MTVVQYGYDASVSCPTRYKLGYDNTDSDVDSCRARRPAQGEAMTTIRGGSALGVEPRVLPVRLSRGAHPTGLVAPGVTRRSRPELPVATGLHPGRRPSRPVAPHREERCPARSRHIHLEFIRS
jgi:hypothetical protein